MSCFIHHRAASPLEENIACSTGTESSGMVVGGEVKGDVSRGKWKQGLQGQEVLPPWALLGQEELCANWSRSQESSTPGTGANRCDTTACRNSEKDDQSGRKLIWQSLVLGWNWDHQEDSTGATSSKLISFGLRHTKEKTALLLVSSSCCFLKIVYFLSLLNFYCVSSEL